MNFYNEKQAVIAFASTINSIERLMKSSRCRKDPKYTEIVKILYNEAFANLAAMIQLHQAHMPVSQSKRYESSLRRTKLFNIKYLTIDMALGQAEVNMTTLSMLISKIRELNTLKEAKAPDHIAESADSFAIWQQDVNKKISVIEGYIKFCIQRDLQYIAAYAKVGKFDSRIEDLVKHGYLPEYVNETVFKTA